MGGSEPGWITCCMPLKVNNIAHPKRLLNQTKLFFTII